MSMIGNLLRVTSVELESYLQNSSLLEDRIYSDNGNIETNLIDIEKSWEGIFYILTGCALANLEDAKPPLSLVLFNPQIIDEEQDLGYGPANYSTAEQVLEISNALNKISDDEFKNRFDENKMMEIGIYPEIWNEGEDAILYLLEYFKELKDFYSLAAQNKEAVITFLN